MQEVIRQGDLLFVRVEEVLKKDATAVQDGILARGEATGHTHKLRADARNRAVRVAQALYVLAAVQAHIDHQEHATVILPPGTWQVKRQREYRPGGWVQVAD
jgi:hypothetical protein